MSKEINSPMLSLVWRLRGLRNEEKDYLLGKVLTIIDSVVSNEKQNKAVKDVIKTSWYERAYYEEHLDELLRQFRDRFCPNIEEGWEEGYRLPTIPTNLPPNQNYFPEN